MFLTHAETVKAMIRDVLPGFLVSLGCTGYSETGDGDFRNEMNGTSTCSVGNGKMIMAPMIKTNLVNC